MTFFVLHTPIWRHCRFEKAALKPKYKKADWSTVVLSGFQFQFWTRKKKKIHFHLPLSLTACQNMWALDILRYLRLVPVTLAALIGSLKDGWTCQPCKGQQNSMPTSFATYEATLSHLFGHFIMVMAAAIIPLCAEKPEKVKQMQFA